MGIAVVIILLLLAVLLFLAEKFRVLNSQTLQVLSAIAGILAFVAALLLFIIPAATPAEKPVVTQTTLTQLTEPTLQVIPIQETQTDVVLEPFPYVPLTTVQNM